MSKKFDCSESCEIRKFQEKCHINLVKNQRKVPEWRHIDSSDSKYCSSLRRWRLRWHSSVYSYTTLFVNMKLSPIHVSIFMMIFNLSEIIDRRDEQLIIWFYQVIFYMQTSYRIYTNTNTIESILLLLIPGCVLREQQSVTRWYSFSNLRPVTAPNSEFVRNPNKRNYRLMYSRDTVSIDQRPCPVRKLERLKNRMQSVAKWISSPSETRTNLHNSRGVVSFILG